MKITTKDIKNIIELKKSFLFDCDGVLWHENNLINGSKQFIEYLQSIGKNTFFLTNNSTKSRDDYVQKFKKLGLQVSKDQIVGSSFVTARYIANHLSFSRGQKVLVLGSSGLCKELDELNIKYLCLDQEASSDIINSSKAVENNEFGIAVFGLDFDISYKKYCAFHKYLSLNKHCTFIATNLDITFPDVDCTYPGTGALLQVIVKSTNRNPDMIMGKPSPHMFEIIKESFDLKTSECIMVGDRMDTDIKFGLNVGIDTILALSGVTKPEHLNSFDYKPTYIIESIADLLIKE